MKSPSLSLLPLAAGAAAAPASALAAPVVLQFELPKLEVAEYHRPYVAAWVETPDNEWVANLSVQYDTGLRNEEGETWLKDLRQWWRRSGRELDLPIDGLSRPTLPPGTHDLEVTEALRQLPQAGDYQLVVEASRENGGREVVKVPFRWDGRAVAAVSGQGETELGAVRLGPELPDEEAASEGNATAATRPDPAANPAG